MYPKVVYFVKTYGSAGITDQKAVQDFVDCETNESIVSLRNELVGLSQGNYTDENMLKLLGANRKVLFSSYHEWAKIMLQWIAAYHKGS